MIGPSVSSPPPRVPERAQSALPSSLWSQPLQHSPAGPRTRLPPGVLSLHFLPPSCSGPHSAVLAARLVWLLISASGISTPEGILLISGRREKEGRGGCCSVQAKRMMCGVINRPGLTCSPSQLQKLQLGNFLFPSRGGGVTQLLTAGERQSWCEEKGPGEKRGSRNLCANVLPAF